MTLGELNRVPARVASEALGSCCASTRWLDGMLAARPFADVAELQAAGERLWRALPPDEWLAAFAAHPRIGERPTGVGTRPGAWSAQEQAAVAQAAPRDQATIARANRDYEDRFGYRYVVCASGRSLEHLLTDCVARLGNDPQAELHVAATEHMKITRLRLAKLLELDSP